MGKDECDALNLKKVVLDWDGKFQIPVIPPYTGAVPGRWIPFGNKVEDVGVSCCHFFLDDWKFERVWNQPERYVYNLRDFHTVTSPDFSPYDDWPLVLQIYNVYRNRWCGAWWAMMGVNVLPTVTWSGRRSFEFAFDGLSRGTGCVISTVGLRNQVGYSDDLFHEGLDVLYSKVDPGFVVGYGVPIDSDYDVEWRSSFAEESLHFIEVISDAEGDEW